MIKKVLNSVTIQGYGIPRMFENYITFVKTGEIKYWI